MFKKLDGSHPVLTIHGDEASCTGFAKDLKEELGLNALAPDVGYKLTI